MRTGKASAKRIKPRRRRRARWLLLATLLAIALYTGREAIGVRILTAAGYPKSLAEKLMRYPETASYVLGYPARSLEHGDRIDLSGELIPGEIPLFLQWDARWGYEMYGNDFMGVNACGPACLSMVCCGLSGEGYWNPREVARMAEESGYYVAGVGSSWELMEEGARKLGLRARDVEMREEQILKALRAGWPVICSVRPGDFTTAGHFIVLARADAQGNITVRDPNSRVNSEKTWRVERLIPQIKKAWAYALSTEA